MDFSLAQLSAFVATVEQGGFERAAKTLDKPRQVIARLVGTMEDGCNVQLFTRRVRRLEPTPAALKLLPLARRSLINAAATSNQIKRIGEASPSQLLLAIDSMFICPEVVACYQHVLEAFPGLALEVMTGSTMEVSEWVERGSVEMALRFYPFSSSEAFISVCAFNFRVINVASAKLRSPAEVLSLDELSQMTQIVPKFVYHFGHEHEHIVSDHRIASNNLQQSLSMVQAGMGWTVLPEMMARDGLQQGELVSLSVEGAVPIAWAAEIIYQDDEKLTLASEMFMQQVQRLDGTFQ